MTSTHISHPGIMHSSHRVSSDPFSWNKCLVKKKKKKKKKGLLASWFSIVEASACLTELIKESCNLTILASPFPDTHSLTQKHTRSIPFSTSATNTYLFCLFFPFPSLHTWQALPPLPPVPCAVLRPCYIPAFGTSAGCPRAQGSTRGTRQV